MTQKSDESAPASRGNDRDADPRDVPSWALEDFEYLRDRLVEKRGVDPVFVDNMLAQSLRRLSEFLANS